MLSLRLRRPRAKLAPPILGGLARDNRGVSAVEFALLAPILIAMVFGMSEICMAVIAQRRVSHSDGAIGDLVAQYGNPQYTSITAPPAISPSLMSDIFTAANLIISPYSTTTFQVRATYINVDSKNIARVNWSCAPSSQGGLTALAATTAMTALPSGVISTTPGDSIIMAETMYNYSSPIGYILKSILKFNNTLYFKPRASTTGVGFAPTSSPTWNNNWDSSSRAQSLTANSVTCSYQTG